MKISRNWSVLPLLLLAAGLLSGCSGGARATNWTGLALANDLLYVADVEQVRAIDVETGEPVWSFPPEPDRAYGPFDTLCMGEDRLFVTSYEQSGGFLTRSAQGVLRALDMEGREAWPDPVVEKGRFAAPAAVADTILVIGNGDGNVYAFNADNGSPAWTFATHDRVWASPLIVSGTVYIASMDHTLYALELASGEEVWRFEAGGAMIARPLLLSDTLFIGAFDQTMYALDRETGEERWHVQGENWFWSTPATDGQVIYAVDVSGYVYAYDASNGQPAWPSTVQVDGPIHLGPVLSEDGETLLIASDSGTLYGLDPATGLELWAQEGKGYISSLETQGDTVYVSRILAAEHVQAFQIENGRLKWVYPRPEEE